LNREASAWATARSNVVIDYFTGVKPASADTAPTGSTLLVTLSKNGSTSTTGGTGATGGFSFATAATGGVVIRTPSESVYGTAVASGSAGWARMRNADDWGTTNTTNIRQDYSIGLAGSGAEIILSDVVIVSGSVHPLGTFTHTVSNN